MSVNSSGGGAVSLVHKMSKKVSQLTKVIHLQNTRSDELGYDRECLVQQHEWEINHIQESCNKELRMQHGKVDVYLERNSGNDEKVSDLEEKLREERRLRLQDRSEFKEQLAGAERQHKESLSRVSLEAEHKVSVMEDSMTEQQKTVQSKQQQQNQYMAGVESAKEEECGKAQQDKRTVELKLQQQIEENILRLKERDALQARQKELESEYNEIGASKTHWQSMCNEKSAELNELQRKFDDLSLNSNSMGNSLHAVEKARMELEARCAQHRDKLEGVLKEQEEQRKKWKSEITSLNDQQQASQDGVVLLEAECAKKDAELARMGVQNKELHVQISQLNQNLQANDQESTSTSQEQSRQRAELAQNQESCRLTRAREQEQLLVLTENKTREIALAKAVEQKEGDISAQRHQIQVLESKLRSSEENYDNEKKEWQVMLDRVKSDSSVMSVELVEKERQAWQQQLAEKQLKQDSLEREQADVQGKSSEMKSLLSQLEGTSAAKSAQQTEELGNARAQATEREQRLNEMGKEQHKQNNDISALLTGKDDLEKQVANMTALLEQSTAGNNELTLHLNKGKEEQAAALAKVDQLSAQCSQTDSALMSKVQSLHLEQDTRDRRVAELEKTLEETNRKANDVHSNFIATQRRLEEQLAHKDAQNGSKTAEQEHSLRIKDEETVSLRRDLSAMHADVSSLQTEIVHSKEQYALLEKEKKDLVSAQNKAQTDLTKEQSTSHSIQQNKHGLEDQVAAQTQQRVQQEQELERAAKEHLAQVELIKAKGVQIDQLSSQAHDFSQQNSVLNAQLDKSRDTISTKIKDNETLARKIKEIEHQHVTVLTTKDQDIFALTKMLETCKQDVSALQNQVEALRLEQEHEKREYKHVLESLSHSHAQKLHTKEEELAQATQHFLSLEQTLRAELDAIEQKFKARPMREEDAQQIGQLKQALKKCDSERKQALDDVKFYKQELVNREETYNKQFTSGGARPTKIGR